ncbi:hypothetical protein C8R47DRAFT_1328045, partial [Mycena vitilis]
ATSDTAPAPPSTTPAISTLHGTTNARIIATPPTAPPASPSTAPASGSQLPFQLRTIAASRCSTALLSSRRRALPSFRRRRAIHPPTISTLSTIHGSPSGTPSPAPTSTSRPPRQPRHDQRGLIACATAPAPAHPQRSVARQRR